MTTIQLPISFNGTGEVSGASFRMVKRTENFLMYRVRMFEKVYYEVFRIKHSPTCIDFKKRIYSETEQKEVYPRSTQFGVTAWTTESKERALEILEEKQAAFSEKTPITQGS